MTVAVAATVTGTVAVAETVTVTVTGAVAVTGTVTVAETGTVAVAVSVTVSVTVSFLMSDWCPGLRPLLAVAAVKGRFLVARNHLLREARRHRATHQL